METIVINHTRSSNYSWGGDSYCPEDEEKFGDIWLHCTEIQAIEATSRSSYGTWKGYQLTLSAEGFAKTVDILKFHGLNAIVKA
jgi:hypothetical protein